MTGETQAFPFGRYRGKPLNEIPHDYLRWVLRNTDVETRRPWLYEAIYDVLGEPAQNDDPWGFNQKGKT